MAEMMRLHQSDDTADRLNKRKRLDELLQRITTNVNNNYSHWPNYETYRSLTVRAQSDMFTYAETTSDTESATYSPDSTNTDDSEKALPKYPSLPEQEVPLDLSVKSKISFEESTTPWHFGQFLHLEQSPPTIQQPLFSTLSPQHISGVVEKVIGNSSIVYPCTMCEQVFSIRDRLAKHVASRHKPPRSPDNKSGRTYECDVCKRTFARSDMLTRHSRLHTGDKPYACSVCNQVFTRSDHLATHQRTHTGEKPYKCPICPYAACRRDMITRHMRTHIIKRSRK